MNLSLHEKCLDCLIACPVQKKVAPTPLPKETVIWKIYVKGIFFRIIK